MDLNYNLIYRPKSLGVKGQLVTKMAEDNKAILSVNGGGFYDPGNNSTGGMPTGITISNGKVITDNNYSSYTQSGGIIGITNNNKLVKYTILTLPLIFKYV